MSNMGRKLLACAALFLACIGLVVVALTSRADATTPPTFQLPPFPGNGGVLRLHMGGSSDYLRFDSGNGSGFTTGTAEPFTTSKCNVASPLPTSMTITPTPNGGSSQGKVGLVGHSFGVQVKGEGNGTPCGQVNGTSQALRLSLAGALASRSMDSAEIDVEAKYGATVKAELFNDGALVRTETVTTTGSGSDSGPDSGPNDNVRWKLPATGAPQIQFDEIKLSVDASTPGGAFSLEGGGDGTPFLPAPSLGATLNTTDSLFHLVGVDGTLQCGGTVSKGGTNGTPSATVTLVDTGATCDDVLYALTVINNGDLQAVAFQKSGGPTNVYNATLTWPIEAAAYPVPPTLIDYGDGSGPHTLQWCNGTYAAPTLPGSEHWCLRKHDATLASTGQMQVIEELFGQGDPGYWR